MIIQLFGGPRDGQTVELEDARIVETVTGGWSLVALDDRPLAPLRDEGYVFAGTYSDRELLGGHYRPLEGS